MNNYVLIIVLNMFDYTAERIKVHLNNSYLRVKSLRIEQFFLHSHAFTLPNVSPSISAVDLPMKPYSFFFSLSTLSVGHPCYLLTVCVLGMCK